MSDTPEEEILETILVGALNTPTPEDDFLDYLNSIEVIDDNGKVIELEIPDDDEDIEEVSEEDYLSDEEERAEFEL